MIPLNKLEALSKIWSPLIRLLKENKFMTLKRAKQVIAIEVKAIKALVKSIDANFQFGCRSDRQMPRPCGCQRYGQDRHHRAKIAQRFHRPELRPCGCHSAEAVHGDLGQVTRNDVMLIICTERRDRGDHAPFAVVRKLGVKIIAMTGNVKSSLAKHSDVVLNVKVDQEGCPLGLARWPHDRDAGLGRCFGCVA